MYRKTKYLLLVWAIFCLVSVSCSSEKGRVKIGSFSVVPPAGWDVRATPGAEYDIIVAPMNQGFGATISFSDGTFSGDFREYMDTLFRVYETSTTDFLNAYQSSFTTDSSLEGQKFVMVTTQQGMKNKLAMYFIKTSKDKYISIYCVATENSFDQCSQPFEATARSFKK